MRTNPLQLVVFDLDGTLVDSLASIQHSMAEAASSVGIAAPHPDLVREVIGLPLHNAVERVFRAAPEPTHADLVAAYKSAFHSLVSRENYQDELFPGAVECLEGLNETGLLLGIATGKGRRGLDIVLENHGLSRHFVTLQTSDLGPGKPHPDMLHRAIDEAGVGPADTVMIGDTTFDMEMAKAAGAAAIGVSWGYHATQSLRDTGADRIVSEFRQVPPAVARLLDVTDLPI